MCLELTDTSKPSAAQTVYKLFEKGPHTGALYGIFQGNQIDLVEGEEIKSNRLVDDLTSSERQTGKVQRGFHGFTTLEGMKKFYAEDIKKKPFFQGKQYVFAEFEGKPEDFVAIGWFHRSPENYRSAVYMKLTFKKFIDLN